MLWMAPSLEVPVLSLSGVSGFGYAVRGMARKRRVPVWWLLQWICVMEGTHLPKDSPHRHSKAAARYGGSAGSRARPKGVFYSLLSPGVDRQRELLNNQYPVELR
jgi:hypothetical protein